MPVLAPPFPCVLAVRVAGCPVRVSLPLACRYAIPCGLCVLQARSGCPLGPHCVSVACEYARAPAAYALPPPRVDVARARRAVLVQDTGRAVPGGSCPSVFPSPSPCSAYLALGGLPVPFLSLPGLWLLAPVRARLPLGAGFARCGGGTRAPGGDASCLAVGRPGMGALQHPTACCPGVQPGPSTRYTDSQQIHFEFAEFAANSFAERIRCELGLKFLVLRVRAEFALRIRRRRQNDQECAVFSPDEKLTLNCAMQ